MFIIGFEFVFCKVYKKIKINKVLLFLFDGYYFISIRSFLGQNVVEVESSIQWLQKQFTILVF